MIKKFVLDKSKYPKAVFIYGYRPGKTGDFGLWLKLLGKRKKYFDHWSVLTKLHKIICLFRQKRLC